MIHTIRGPFRRKGLTYIEAVISLLILSTATVAGLKVYGSYAMTKRTWNERAVGIELADQLMAEINTLPFMDPSGNNTIGIDSGESAGNRLTFNDIDDWNGWNASPPIDATGATMTEYSGYRTQVTVAFDDALAAATGLTFTSNSFKAITVRAFKDNRELVKLVTIRANHNANQ